VRQLRAPMAPDEDAPRPWLFLTGAIDRGAAACWQDQVVAALAGTPGCVLNPRRDHWDAAWDSDPDGNDPAFVEQVAWELGGLEQADLIACWLPAGSQAPTSLLELGLHARHGRVRVGCAPGFHRRGNVLAVCRRYGLLQVDSLPDLVRVLAAELERYSRLDADEQHA